MMVIHITDLQGFFFKAISTSTPASLIKGRCCPGHTEVAPPIRIREIREEFSCDLWSISDNEGSASKSQ